MTISLLTQDQKDVLQEVTNIAMGQAGNSLAQLLGTFVTLSVPRINVVDVADINDTIGKILGDHVEVSAVRQAFLGSFRGEAIAIFHKDSHGDIADLMGYEGDLSEAQEDELLLDVANVLIGACLTGIGELLGASMSFSAPSMMAKSTPVQSLFQPDQLTWRCALVVEVNFALEARNFTCHLTQLMPEESISTLQTSLDDFMESL
ncbi:chemotaxis protein CheC [Leeia oryzae]|uniref:chemotaxis protein CheC n=1 Tax=Leeia oryzae TaxID=356662 RepID=UPI00037B7778|nr:chemotaxis protein CheC [Leeia oryzae]